MNDQVLSPEFSKSVPVAAADQGDERVSTLTAGMAAGREEAWVQFHAEYFDRLLRYLFVVCRGDEEAAREALQAAFVKISRTVRRFECEEYWWSWLAAVARSCVIDGARKRSRYRAALERYAGWFMRPAEVVERPVSLMALLEECLATLDPVDRELVMAKYQFGESVDALAEDAGCSTKAMEYRLGKLRRLLKKKLLDRLRHEK